MKKRGTILLLWCYAVALSGVHLSAHACCSGHLTLDIGPCGSFCQEPESSHCAASLPAACSCSSLGETDLVAPNTPKHSCSPVHAIVSVLQAPRALVPDEYIPRLYPPPRSIYLQYSVFRI